MSYGLTFVNSSDVVTLDSEFSRLVVLHSGNYSGSASFPQPITTQEPPLVFIRPNASTTLQYATIYGGPGYWTGFGFVGGGSGRYFAAAFESKELAEFGMRLWGSAGKILFDSGTPCAQFTRTITSWSYIGSVPWGGQGLRRANFTAYSPLDSGDYMMINNVAMDVNGADTRFSKLYCDWGYGNNRIVPFIVGPSSSTSFWIPIVFAKPIL